MSESNHPERRQHEPRRFEDKTGVAILQAVSYVLAVVLGYVACAVITLPSLEAVATQLAACFAGTVTAVGLWFSVGKPMLENYKQLKADEMERLKTKSEEQDAKIFMLETEMKQLRFSHTDLMVQNRALLARLTSKHGLADFDFSAAED